METRAVNTTAYEQPMQRQAKQSDRAPQPCSICSGQLTMDAEGTALFCDACWDRKWFMALESD